MLSPKAHQNTLLTYVLGPSGGMFYHLAALRYRQNLWRPFITDLNDWLCRYWDPLADELVIFGSSAGWTIEPRFVERFRRVIVVEPDPVARFAFRRRFTGCVVEAFKDRDLLPWASQNRQAFAEFLARFPKAAVLFSNVLGQLPLLGPFAVVGALAQAEFLRALRGREWASYHDLLSFAGTAKKSSAEKIPAHFRVGLSDLARGAFACDDLTQVIDHETSWLNEGRAWHAFTWQLRPEQAQLVVGVAERSVHGARA